jgi:hypothetical protein
MAVAHAMTGDALRANAFKPQWLAKKINDPGEVPTDRPVGEQAFAGRRGGLYLRIAGRRGQSDNYYSEANYSTSQGHQCFSRVR